MSDIFNITLTEAEGVVSRINDDGKIILMKMDDSDSFFKISGVAAKFWKNIFQQKMSTKQAVEDLLQNYNVEQEILVEDLNKLIEELKEKKLIQ
jgi:hypothetical protein